MKIMLLGISIMLFGLALIGGSTGGAGSFGLGISFAGLIVSVIGLFKTEN